MTGDIFATADSVSSREGYLISLAKCNRYIHSALHALKKQHLRFCVVNHSLHDRVAIAFLFCNISTSGM